MYIKQISIFVENKPGRLAEVTGILSKNNIDIRALSVADTRDFGILRLIVNNPDAAIKILKEEGLTVSITNVIAIGVEDKPGGLAKIMQIMFENELSIEYMYAFIGERSDKAYVILRVDNFEKSVETFEKCNIELLSSKDIYKD